MEFPILEINTSCSRTLILILETKCAIIIKLLEKDKPLPETKGYEFEEHMHGYQL